MIISRGMPGTAAARQPAATGTIPSSLHTSSSSSSSSSWFSYDAYEASLARGSSSSAWQRGFTRAICSSWPYFTGGAADVHVGNSPAFVWSASKQGELDTMKLYCPELALYLAASNICICRHRCIAVYALLSWDRYMPLVLVPLLWLLMQTVIICNHWQVSCTV